MSHTPGPWTSVDQAEGSRGGSLGFCIKDRRGLPLFFLPRGSAEAEANARLIAAAPDLLAALKETREIAAACFRAMAELGCVDAVLAQLPPGLEEKSAGFGVRADDAIADAEGTPI